MYQKAAGKIDQMAIKYTKIFHCKTLQNLPKLGFLFENTPSGNRGGRFLKKKPSRGVALSSIEAWSKLGRSVIEVCFTSIANELAQVLRRALQVTEQSFVSITELR
jgi:hypothetical protein